MILWVFSVKALLKVNPKMSCFKLVWKALFCFCLPRGESKTSVFITSHSSQVVKSVLQYETNLGVNIWSIRLKIVILSKDLKIRDLKRIAFEFFLHSAVLFPKNEALQSHGVGRMAVDLISCGKCALKSWQNRLLNWFNMFKLSKTVTY